MKISDIKKAIRDYRNTDEIFIKIGNKKEVDFVIPVGDLSTSVGIISSKFFTKISKKKGGDINGTDKQ